MPYEVKRRGSKFVLKKKGEGGRVLGTHPTRAKALAQMRAVYASEGRKKKGR